MNTITEGISNRFMIAVLAIVLFKVVVTQGSVEAERDASMQKHARTAPAHFLIR